jgi:glycosyltransferase involved in cell wall biosynthesis
MQNKRILYLTLYPDLKHGGQVSLLNLLQGLDRNRYVPMLIVPEEDTLAEEARKLDIEVEIHPPWPHVFKTPLWKTIKSLCQMRRSISRFKPDIIHVDVPRIAHLISLVKGKAKLLMHLRVTNFDGFSDRLLAYECDAMIAIAKGVADRFKAYPKKTRNKIDIVYNGVNTNRFSPVTPEQKSELRKLFSLDSKSLIAVVLAEFVEFKNHDFLLDIWKPIHKRTGAKLIFAGTDGGKLDHLKMRVKEEQLNEIVEFLPFVEKPYQLFQTSDLNLLASKSSEGFGRVIVEAGSCGVPSVASDYPGINEAIEHNKSGLLLLINNKKLWTESIVELLNDKKEIQRLGNRARWLACEKFSQEAYSNGVMDVYEKLT